MKRLCLLLFIAFFATGLRAQSVSDTSFPSIKKYVDSLTLAIDNNKALTSNLFFGELMYGSFKANCFYLVGSNNISKMECFFNDAAAGKKVLYYQDNVLVRIIDKGQLYYCSGNNLFDEYGRKVKQYVAKDVIFFSQELNKMLLAMMD